MKGNVLSEFLVRNKELGVLGPQIYMDEAKTTVLTAPAERLFVRSIVGNVQDRRGKTLVFTHHNLVPTVLRSQCLLSQSNTSFRMRNLYCVTVCKYVFYWQ